HMEVKAEPHISPRDEGGYQVTLEGEKLGALIGHRGETLDSIQQLTNYSINRGRARRVRIHIDVENYRSKREEALQHLAQKVAGKVVKYRRNITLEPMNAYERHVIHEALQEYPDVVTYSTGTEPNRRTVVAYTKGKHSY
ncbi:MAG: R-binding protein Jag, partial [Evtepia sp.]|nr:R-binding protein Jag [Evtepia sp.]